MKTPHDIRAMSVCVGARQHVSQPVPGSLIRIHRIPVAQRSGSL
jgi:hypothetical protein